jgi:hypothetical protein
MYNVQSKITRDMMWRRKSGADCRLASSIQQNNENNMLRAMPCLLPHIILSIMNNRYILYFMDEMRFVRFNANLYKLRKLHAEGDFIQVNNE